MLGSFIAGMLGMWAVSSGVDAGERFIKRAGRKLSRAAREYVRERIKAAGELALWVDDESDSFYIDDSWHHFTNRDARVRFADATGIRVNLDDESWGKCTD